MKSTLAKYQYLLVGIITVQVSFASAQTDTIYLVPIGLVNSERIEMVEQAVTDHYQVKAVLEEPIAVRAAFITKFDTILNAEATNDFLANKYHGEVKVLGITDWALTIGNQAPMLVRGYAVGINGKSATISSHKVLSESYEGKSDNFEFMFQKVAIHELGHLFGLAHCSNETCLMTFGSNFQSSSKHLCPLCLRILKGKKIIKL